MVPHLLERPPDATGALNQKCVSLHRGVSAPLVLVSAWKRMKLWFSSEQGMKSMSQDLQSSQGVQEKEIFFQISITALSAGLTVPCQVAAGSSRWEGEPVLTLTNQVAALAGTTVVEMNTGSSPYPGFSGDHIEFCSQVWRVQQ